MIGIHPMLTPCKDKQQLKSTEFQEKQEGKYKKYMRTQS